MSGFISHIPGLQGEWKLYSIDYSSGKQVGSQSDLYREWIRAAEDWDAADDNPFLKADSDLTLNRVAPDRLFVYRQRSFLRTDYEIHEHQKPAPLPGGFINWNDIPYSNKAAILNQGFIVVGREWGLPLRWRQELHHATPPVYAPGLRLSLIHI